MAMKIAVSNPAAKPKNHFVGCVSSKRQMHGTSLPGIDLYQIMKVYIDCIEETIVANSLTQEIATVTVPNKEEGQIHVVFGNLNYVPLNKQKIETIKMECRDLYGKLFPLNGGHVEARFHFRRCQLTL